MNPNSITLEFSNVIVHSDGTIDFVVPTIDGGFGSYKLKSKDMGEAFKIERMTESYQTIGCLKPANFECGSIFLKNKLKNSH